MITLSREEIKSHDVFNRIFESVKKNHKVPEHTIKVLRENENIKDFCEISQHFCLMVNKSPLHLSYEVSAWIKDNRILTRIDSITFYDNQIEYDLARAKGIQSPNPGNFAERN